MADATPANDGPLPSQDPVDVLPEPPMPTPPPGKTTIPSTAAPAASSAPASLDAFLARVRRIATTRSGADSILLFTCYAASLSGNFLEAASRAALPTSVGELVSLVLDSPPSKPLRLPPPSLLVSRLAILALRLSVRLKAAAAMLSEIRTFGRIWGLLDLYFAAKKLLLSARDSVTSTSEEKKTAVADNSFDALVGAAQLVSLISFQVAESTAYLSSRNALPFSPATQGRLSLWSVRSWMAYTGMELGRLLVVRQRRLQKAGGRLVTAEDREWGAGWKKDFLCCLAWSPITVHYSFGDGFLSALTVSLLAFYPAVTQMKDVWRSNA